MRFPPSTLDANLYCHCAGLIQAAIILRFRGYRFSIIYRTHYLTEDILACWIFLDSGMFPDPYFQGLDCRHIHSGWHPISSCFLHFDQLQISFCSKRRFIDERLKLHQFVDRYKDIFIYNKTRKYRGLEKYQQQVLLQDPWPYQSWVVYCIHRTTHAFPPIQWALHTIGQLQDQVISDTIVLQETSCHAGYCDHRLYIWVELLVDVFLLAVCIMSSCTLRTSPQGGSFSDSSSYILQNSMSKICGVLQMLE